MSPPNGDGPINQGIFFETIRQLREDFGNAHDRLRQDMNGGFERITKEGYGSQIIALSEKLVIIQTERKYERGIRDRRAMLLGSVSGGTIAVILFLVNHFWKP